jgi:outer membrane protein OmpA-like peptidoglycan-associated protein
MMIAALLALCVGALAGVFLATRHFLRRRLPASVALFHGMGGAVGFALVLMTVFREPTFALIRTVLYLLIATVVLGCVNLLFHVRRVRHRTSIIALHALTALASAGTLIKAIQVHSGSAGESAPPPSAPPANATPLVATVSADGGAHAATGVTTNSNATLESGPSASPLAAESSDETVRRAISRAVRFETNSVDVRGEASVVIAEIADALKKNAEIALVEVQGHADERGDGRQNVQLTRMRAEAVVNALVANGVARDRLRSAGFGARCPADPACRHANADPSCHTSAKWEDDRRVAFAVVRPTTLAFHTELACAEASAARTAGAGARARDTFTATVGP